MNIEVKRSIEIDDLLSVLKLESESGQASVVTIDRELLKDAVQVIKVLVKKNKQLRDINKNLSDKVVKKDEAISKLAKQANELNNELFEIQKKFDSCRNDTCNNCCKGKESLQQINNGNPKKCKEKSESNEEISTEEEMLEELQKILDVIPVMTILTMLGIL